MIDVALRFAYDGARFPSGYAQQPQGGTVENALLEALAKHGMIADSWKTGSRTDRGVSAAENVAAVRVHRPLRGLVPALQSDLPEGVWIRGACIVPADWNPRHHAVRTYRYLAPYRGEDMDIMKRAVALFIGTHDFRAFAKVEPHRDPVRTITQCTVEQDGDWLEFTVASPGFLWNQVRRMVDVILRVGAEKLPFESIQDAVVSGTPHRAMKRAPAQGLLLQSVTYTPPLEWDPVAGALGSGYTGPARQDAAVRSRLMQELDAP